MNREGEERKRVLAKHEGRAVYASKSLVLIVLASVIVFGVVMYVYSKKDEDEKFRDQFENHALRVIEAFKEKTKQSFGIIDNHALAITSHSKSSQGFFPFITIPDWEIRCSSVRILAGVMSVWMVPIVKEQEREKWELYSVENQRWLTEGLAIQKQKGLHNGYSIDSIPASIYKVDGLGPVPEDGSGPYYPVWQVAPAIPLPSVVNFNLISHPGFSDAIRALIETKRPVTGRSFDYSDPNDKQTIGRRDLFNLILSSDGDYGTYYQDDPVSDFYYPVYDGFDEGNEPKLVAFLTSLIYWRKYFMAILPENVVGIVVVLENTCNQSYTYQIDGEEVQYIGPGDQHDTNYDSLELSRDFHTVWDSTLSRNESGSVEGSSGNCLYKLRVFPSKEFQDEYDTNKPAMYSMCLAFVVLFISSVLIFYDRLVERRQKVVMKEAVQSRDIVSSLFPQNVHDRLFDEFKDDHVEGGKMRKRTSRWSMRSLGQKESIMGLNSSGSMTLSQQQQHISDFFQNCTVCFADLVGFTRWSDQRSAEDVFTLLGSLYEAFDEIANENGAYKIEVIGDCYLAVAGLPEPRDDHATVMVNFSIDCMLKMKQVLHDLLLEDLGDDTLDLSLRIGLSSGPVIAGVLRGKNSRFQIFGDTVNTAARMESNGAPEKIHVSESTAKLLLADGKGQWLTERDEKIEVKGKGELQTYWINYAMNTSNKITDTTESCSARESTRSSDR